MKPSPSQIAVMSTLSRHDRAKRLEKKSSIIKEKRHLSSVLVSNGFPFSFVQRVTKTRNSSLSRGPVTQLKSTAFLPYVKGVSEPLRRCLKQQGIRRSSSPRRHLHLVRPKDIVNPARQDSVIYTIPCECGKIYIGEMGRPMQERRKEHERDICLACTQTSAVSTCVNNLEVY